MLPYLNVFGAAIAFPPLIILAGLWLGASLAEKYAHQRQVDPAVIYNLLFISLAAFVLGGRLGFAAQHPSAFMQDPASLISRNFGLFDPLSGAVVGLIALAVYAQRKAITFWPLLDALTPALAVIMLAVPLANFASGSAYGAPSQLPWAIELWGLARHPVQLYEAAAAGLILWLVWPARQAKTLPGLNFLSFVVYSAMARLFFEGFRGSSPVTMLNLRQAQLIAWIILALSLWIVHKRRQQSDNTKP